MENKSLWNQAVPKENIDNVTVLDESVAFTFNTGNKITFSTYHDQDCCESVYGDFSVFKYYTENLRGKTIENIEVKSVKDMGFLIVLQTGYNSYEKIFVPCYNYQNGYYSSNLKLTIEQGVEKIQIDISDCVEDHIR